MGDRRGAPPPRRRCTARRVRALRAAPRGRRLARPLGRLRAPAGDPVARAREAAAADRHLPLRLRPHARAAVAPVPGAAPVREEVGDALPRLGHPRQDAGAARLRQEGRRRDRRQLRRDPLGARGGGAAAGNRRLADHALATVRPHAGP